jgi:hypothetical protein
MYPYKVSVRKVYHCDLCVTRKTWAMGLAHGFVRPLGGPLEPYASLTGDVISARVAYAGHTYHATSPRGGSKVELREL